MDGVGGLTQAPVAPGESYRLPLHAARCRDIPHSALASSAGAPNRWSGACRAFSSSRRQTLRQSARISPSWSTTGSSTRRVARPIRRRPGQATGRLGNRLTREWQAGTARASQVDTRTARIRMRIANACNARVLRAASSTGFKPSWRRSTASRPTVRAAAGDPALRARDPLRLLHAMCPRRPGVSGDRDRGDRRRDSPLTLKTTGASLQRRDAAVLPALKNEKLPAAIRLQGATRKDVVITADPAGAAW